MGLALRSVDNGGRLYADSNTPPWHDAITICNETPSVRPKFNRNLLKTRQVVRLCLKQIQRHLFDLDGTTNGSGQGIEQQSVDSRFLGSFDTGCGAKIEHRHV